MAKPTKQATKGQKQIYEENRNTIRFYSLMSGIGVTVYLIFYLLIYSAPITYSNWFFIAFQLMIHGSAISTMKYMARPTFSETGSLVDGGLDLNMQSGFSEHLKDIIILTTICQLLSVISIYFWNLWLFVPARAFYMLWVNIIGPWIFEPAPEEDEEVNEKKQKKLERKMKRLNNMRQ